MVFLVAVFLGAAQAFLGSPPPFAPAPLVRSPMCLLAKKNPIVDENGVEIKRAVTAYMHFCADQRPMVTQMLKTQLGSEFRPTLVMTELGKLWSGLETEKRLFYQNKATADRERFEAATARLGIKVSSSGSSKRKKAPSARGKSGYLLFCDDVRESVALELKTALGDAFQYKEVMKVLGAKWKALPEAERKRYNDLSAAEKQAIIAANAPPGYAPGVPPPPMVDAVPAPTPQQQQQQQPSWDFVFSSPFK